MISLAKKLWPLNRSLTGKDNIKTLLEIKKINKNLNIIKFKSGMRVFDWKIPQVWEPIDAYILDPKKKKICDFKKNNLHLIGYSKSVKKNMKLNELKKKLYSLPNIPDAIPYLTTYYKKNWGFCITHNEKKKLKTGNYQVYIDTKFSHGFMHIGEIYLKGKSKSEILLSTYICHPSMANNELSGVVLATYLSKWLKKIKNLRYSYRILFLPETIGSITYLSKNYRKLKKNVIAGYNLTCVGDDRNFSFLPSKDGNTISDKIALKILNENVKKFKIYQWKDRGSDERQYCAPGIDLPVCSIMRSKYGDYPEYHTSEDNLGLISSQGFQGSFDAHIDMIQILESNKKYKATYLGEPQLGKRNLRSDMGAGKGLSDNFKNISDFLAYADGELDIIDIANILNIYALDLIPIVTILQKHGLIKSVD